MEFVVDYIIENPTFLNQKEQIKISALTIYSGLNQLI